MTTLFLFGAGASYGSEDVLPHPPPLGQQVFSALDSSDGVTAQFPASVRDAFEQNFEDGMAALSETHPDLIASFQRELAAFFASFCAGPANIYGEIIDAVRNREGSVVFSTLNYDTLLEQSLSLRGYRMSYIAGFVPAGAFRVRKPHGSCHFLPDLGGTVFHNCLATGNGRAELSAPVRIEPIMTNVVAYCRNTTSFAPAIALYARGKPVLHCPDFVENQQSIWKLDVAIATRIFIIGVAVNIRDFHLWGPLARSAAQLVYLNPDCQPFKDWVRDNGREDTVCRPQTFAESVATIRELLHSEPGA